MRQVIAHNALNFNGEAIRDGGGEAFGSLVKYRP